MAGRVVRDGNIITGGGITAGIDFALGIAAEVLGDDAARAIQLGLEYNPQPPFDSGSPDRADAALVERTRSMAAARQSERAAAVERAAKKLQTN